MVENMLMPVQLVPNKWNPNVMQSEEFQALKKDMQNSGPDEIDAVLVSPFDIFYIEANVESLPDCFVIVDGEHRWTAAKELGWDLLRCDVKDITEEDAKGICYRKNKDRGSIDPFKEAALFKSEVDAGLTQKVIAEKFLVDPTTVSHRLSLLKLAPEVKEKISMLPRGTVTPSHLEPIASLPEEEQVKVELVSRWDTDRARSVQDIADDVKRTKERLAEKKALSDALKSAKFPVCPKCGAAPDSIHRCGLPIVCCSSGLSWDPEHQWNLETGEPQYRPVRVSESLDKKKEPQLSSVIRSNFTCKQIAEAFFSSIKAVLPDLESAGKISIHGKLKGESFSVNFCHGPNGMDVSVGYGKGSRGLSFRAETKEYQSGHKSKIECGCYQPKQEDLNQYSMFIDNAFKNILLPLPEKMKPAKPEAVADLPGDFRPYCVVCGGRFEDDKTVHYQSQIYCELCALLCNLPGHECEDAALNAKALARRETLRAEGKVLETPTTAEVHTR
jgi:ParB/RepB/Spo0J family partition protein